MNVSSSQELTNIENYINNTFQAGGAPSPATVRKWCAKGEVDARKIGGTWFIVVDKNHPITGNPLVDQVLAG